MPLELEPTTEWLRLAEVVEVTDLAELEQYRLAWNALLPGTPRASFFHTYDWLAANWRHTASDRRRFRVLVVRAAGTVVGILPLCIQTEQYRTGSVRVLTYPLGDWGMWYGPIGPNQAATMRVGMEHLRRTRRDWDLLELRWVDAQPIDRAATVSTLRAVGLTARMSPYQSTSVIEMPDSWEAYLAARSSKQRHEIRRQLRVVDELGNAEFIRHRPAGAAAGDADPRWDLLDACEHVAQASWQGSSTTGNTITHPEVRPFLRECHGIAARLGMLDMVLLKINGMPAAFSYNYVNNGWVTGLRMGYDGDVSIRGLGRGMLATIIHDSCQRGDTAIDLGIGEYDFKRRFRTAVQENYRVTHYPPLAFRSLGVRLTRWLKTQTTAATSGKLATADADEPSAV